MKQGINLDLKKEGLEAWLQSALDAEGQSPILVPLRLVTIDREARGNRAPGALMLSIPNSDPKKSPIVARKAARYVDYETDVFFFPSGPDDCHSVIQDDQIEWEKIKAIAFVEEYTKHIAHDTSWVPSWTEKLRAICKRLCELHEVLPNLQHVIMVDDQRKESDNDAVEAGWCPCKKPMTFIHACYRKSDYAKAFSTDGEYMNCFPDCGVPTYFARID